MSSKHSKAKSARMKLRANANGVSLRIRDDGKGFDSDNSDRGSGIGLVSTTERPLDVMLVTERCDPWGILASFDAKLAPQTL
jgi:nitrate/nitrite-specific signal transduction histidine kinase